MALSPLSNSSSAFRVPSQNSTASQLEGVSPHHGHHGGCAKPASNPLSSLNQDGFSAGPAKGAQWDKFLQGINKIATELEQLVKQLQVSELGASPAGGVGGAAPGGEGGVGGASGAAPAPGGVQGPSEAAGPQAPSSAGEAPQGQVGDWIKQAQEVLSKAGVPADKMNGQDIARIIEHESSGNPNAINLTDQNAQEGHPSIGLMQTIQSTFDAFKVPGHDNIRNPVDNIVAAVRYAVDRYGSVSNVPGIEGLNKGGGYVGY